ncbi:ribosome-associated translation inhibitor RaiA [Corallococcus praedator]|uniref:Ribosome-associated translation inhibitor RaiA n=2 Tax=Corallococcus TaxID=83461 RepID=A0A3A8J4K5_9BACT|nr:MULTISPECIES: ribosome-associated translation inhibitor RaiA [Corallococcus]MCY1046025.1 ribosome-associated translation inhibitor RaiA [Corallococcus sp. bb12-1]RKG85481.1 ribosome-associated translation inhibitor RaiA [Corallococcus terminator]RKH10800.1 ribosome-associated translation inhibitor RaiA [Corallococcus sp. CA047B]RKH33546.1 ribosome-associated translation inhibitor RaiA [Corallococcus sp. CA031C]RKI02393.1 ribosome-associated translation inhibitor RaiA [Corallococcus praedato
MKVLLRGVHLKLSDNLKAYTDEHLVAHIERFAEDEASEIDIALVDINGPNKGGVDKECRVTVRMPGMEAVHVTETAETLFQAIDATRDRLEKTIKRAVERRRSVATNGLPYDLNADAASNL